MINTAQLRIGNIISFNGDWHVVTGVRSNIIFSKPVGQKDDDCFEMSDCYDPIKLTPELLEKAGFEIDEDNYAVRGDYRIFCGDFEFYHLEHFWDDDDGGRWLLVPGQIYFLHQLQNVYFACTGEELPIKLQKTYEQRVWKTIPSQSIRQRRN